MSCKPILDHERVIWLETFFYSTTLLAYSITRGLERRGDQGSPPFNYFSTTKTSVPSTNAHFKFAIVVIKK